jgi:hypothetical protein
MEDRGILKKRTRCSIYKAQLVGAFIGGFGTAGFVFLCALLNDPHHELPSFAGIIQILISLPTHALYQLFGKRFVLSTDAAGAIEVVPLLLLCAINAGILALVGTVIGCFIARKRQSNV